MDCAGVSPNVKRHEALMMLWSFCSLTETIVALKEIRLQQEEGAPFTAIREGEFCCTACRAGDTVQHRCV